MKTAFSLPLFSLILAANFTFSEAQSQTLAAETASDIESNFQWSAQWITPARSEPNTWTIFRKKFSIEKIPTVLSARIAVDSKYWLFINGNMVVFEGGLKRGPTPTGTYFDQVDIARYLTKGQNTIAVLAWFFGKRGFSHNNSGRAGFLFEAEVDGKKLISDRSWRMKTHPAFSTASGTQPNYRLSESSIRYDARQDLPGWNLPEYDDSNWQDIPVEAGQPPAKPWGDLHARPIPQWKDFGLTDYVNAEQLPKEGNGKTIIAQLPYNAQITPYLKIDAKEGLLIDIRTDNFEGGRSPNFHGEYITTGGEQEFELPGWINGHDVRYTIPRGVKILELKYRETGYNAEFVGSFTSDDAALNSLWEKSRRTLYITMRDNYMDCPDRERAQWWGDAVNEIGEAFYVFDSKNGPALARKAILELMQWQRPDGTIYSPVPAAIPSARPGKDDGTWAKELPLQMLASVGWYGFWTYYQYTGDLPTIAKVYPAVKRYLEVWKINSSGLVEHRAGDWDWADWGKNIDTAVLENAWYYLALKGAREMALITNNNKDAARYQAQMNSIESAFNKNFWNGREYRSSSYRDKTDDRAQAMAVVAGLAKPEQYSAIRSVLEKTFEASPYMEKYVLEALFIMGAPDQAMNRMKSRYADQITSSLTTLWEGWGIGSKGYGGGTYNHAWSGGPLTILSQYAAGVAPTSVAWKTWSLKPQPGSLKEILTVTPTPNGEIKFDYRDMGSSIVIDVTAPAGTTGELILPSEVLRHFSKGTLGVTPIEIQKPIVINPGQSRIVIQ